MTIFLVWLSILAGVVTLVLVISSLRKVVAQAGGVSRLVVATIIFSVITSVLTILSLIAALQPARTLLGPSRRASPRCQMISHAR